jgi:hypothetical protein
MMRHVGWVGWILLSCKPAEEPTAGDTAAPEADADTDADSDTDTEIGCTRMLAGPWALDHAPTATTLGTAPYGTLSMDPAGCSFVFTEWDTPPDGLPTGGTVTDSDLVLSGSAYWESCTGTVTSDGIDASGTCAEDGEAFSLSGPTIPM